MANEFVVYPAYSSPELITGQSIDKVSQVYPYRKYERNHKKGKDKKQDSFSKISAKEKRDRRWETGDVSAYTEIGDPGFFFDYKM